MNSRQMVELAALVSAKAPTFVDAANALPEGAVEDCWSSNHQRQTRWTLALDQYRSLAGYPSLEGAGKLQGSMFEDMARAGDDEAIEYLQGIAVELRLLGVTKTKEMVLRPKNRGESFGSS